MKNDYEKLKAAEIVFQQNGGNWITPHSKISGMKTSEVHTTVQRLIQPSQIEEKSATISQPKNLNHTISMRSSPDKNSFYAKINAYQLGIQLSRNGKFMIAKVDLGGVYVFDIENESIALKLDRETQLNHPGKYGTQFVGTFVNHIAGQDYIVRNTDRGEIELYDLMKDVIQKFTFPLSNSEFVYLAKYDFRTNSVLLATSLKTFYKIDLNTTSRALSLMTDYSIPAINQSIDIALPPYGNSDITANPNIPLPYYFEKESLPHWRENLRIFERSSNTSWTLQDISIADITDDSRYLYMWFYQSRSFRGNHVLYRIYDNLKREASPILTQKPAIHGNFFIRSSESDPTGEAVVYHEDDTLSVYNVESKASVNVESLTLFVENPSSLFSYGVYTKKGRALLTATNDGDFSVTFVDKK